MYARDTHPKKLDDNYTLGKNCIFWRYDHWHDFTYIGTTGPIKIKFVNWKVRGNQT